jgi:hypothetical protein
MDHVDEPIRAVAEELLRDVPDGIAEARKAELEAPPDAEGTRPRAHEGAAGER